MCVGANAIDALYSPSVCSVMFAAGESKNTTVSSNRVMFVLALSESTWLHNAYLWSMLRVQLFVFGV